MAVGLGKAQLHNLRAQHAQRPVVVPIGRLRAGNGRNHCGLFRIELGSEARAGQLA